ncbi:uncharacterized protein, partial [Halyomorpha halys]|uniref:uncharacterized protein n=1 Tax=Halyomorpha halys TaxID=286706 RepID=UPI0034D2D91D
MLENLGKTVFFIWVPGHVGITGNELADIAAKQALDLPGQGTAILTPQEISLPMKNEISSSWQAMWDETPPSKLNTIKKPTKPWTTSNRSNRREEVAIPRLRIGHTSLTHRYLISMQPPPKCQYYNS